MKTPTLLQKLIATAAVCAVTCIPTLASAQTVPLSENFDTSLGYFRIRVNMPDVIDTNNGAIWNNSSIAGGTAGELESLLVRTDNSQAAYIGSKLYGTLSSSSSDIVLSGKLQLQNINFDGGLSIAMVDTNNLTGAILGLSISEPGGGSEPYFRGKAFGPGCDSGQIAIPDSQSIDFNLVWSAATNRLTGMVWTNVIDLVGSPGASYNALVVGAWGASGGAVTRQTLLFVDNLVFTSLPPPPLEVAVTNPLSGSSIFAGTSQQLDAWAVANTGTVSKVEFYQQPTNSLTVTKISETNAEPYSVTWSNVPSGVYWLTAVAYDNLANSVTSAPVLFTATTVPSVSVVMHHPSATDDGLVVAQGVYWPRPGTNTVGPGSTTVAPVVTIEATNTWNTGTITNVSFYAQVGANTIKKIGETAILTSTNTCSIEWTNPPPGNYRLTARAYTDAGAAATSAPTRFYVLVPRPTMLVTNNFTIGPGRWTATRNNFTNGNAFYWTNTSSAGGSAGEIFALLAGTSAEKQAWIGDTNLNGRLQPSFQNLTFKGTLRATNINLGTDGTLILGFQNTYRPLNVLGFAEGLVGSPSSSGFVFRVGSMDLSTANLVVRYTNTYPFELNWNCTNGTMTGFIGTDTINHTETQIMPLNRVFDAVSIITTWEDSSAPTKQAIIWLDDVVYDVIVPPTLNVTQSGGQVQISWPGAGYVLQSRNSLSSGSWVDRTETPVQNGNTFTVTLPASASSTFFRLIW